jgi:hypothetical protein
MVSKRLCISRLRSGGLITNYYCSSACRHCLYRCSPRWPKDFISPEETREALETSRQLGCRALHIGGGEPLLNPGGVAAVLSAAQDAGVAIEYVETNASWYRNHETACALLEKLVAAGLFTLLVSISPFHNEFIPFRKVRGVLAACRENGISVLPWIAGFTADLEAFDPERPHALEEYKEAFGADYLPRLTGRYWVSPGGRALETFGPYMKQIPVNRLIAETRAGCAELADTGHFHLDLYGNYVPGLCAGLAIGRQDLGSPLDTEAYPLITRLYAGGLGPLLSYVSGEHGFTPSKESYAFKCELCYEVRRFLVIERGVNSCEIRPREHYLLQDYRRT